VLQFIAIARYPHQFAWHSTSGAVYLIVLASMLLTGVVGGARGLPKHRRLTGSHAHGV